MIPVDLTNSKRFDVFVSSRELPKGDHRELGVVGAEPPADAFYI